MLLTIDVGNTNTVLGVFDGADVVEHWRISTDPVRTADELAVLMQGLLLQSTMFSEPDINGRSSNSALILGKAVCCW